MSVMLRVSLILMSFASLFYIIRKIRYSKMQIEYAIFWIVLSVAMIIMSVCPQIVYWIRMMMGMVSAANVVYLFIIAVLLLKVFMMTIEISNLENKIKDLAQQVGINDNKYQKKMESLEERLDK